MEFALSTVQYLGKKSFESQSAEVDRQKVFVGGACESEGESAAIHHHYATHHLEIADPEASDSLPSTSTRGRELTADATRDSRNEQAGRS